MIIKLNSEFESVDSAEFAARAIKNTVKDVNSVSVREIRNKKEHEHDNFYIPTYFQGSLTNALPIIRIDNYNSDNDEYYKNKAILEVLCDIKSQNTVNQIMLSNGGLKINKS